LVCNILLPIITRYLKEYINLCFSSGDINTLLNYQTAAQRRNIPIMLGIDGIQKVYGSSNNFIPPAITTLVRNMGFAFCQSTSLIKV